MRALFTVLLIGLPALAQQPRHEISLEGRAEAIRQAREHCYGDLYRFGENGLDLLRGTYRVQLAYCLELVRVGEIIDAARRPSTEMEIRAHVHAATQVAERVARAAVNNGPWPDADCLAAYQEAFDHFLALEKKALEVFKSVEQE